MKKPLKIIIAVILGLIAFAGIVAIVLGVTTSKPSITTTTPASPKVYSEPSVQEFNGKLTVSTVGIVKEEETLTVISEGLTPAPQNIEYIWFADSEPLPGRGTQLFLDKTLNGKTISVKAKASSLNYISVNETSVETLPVEALPIEIPLPVKATSINSGELKNLVAEVLNQYSGQYSVTLTELDGLKRNFNINGTAELDPASTIKTFYAYHILKKAEKGLIDLNSTLPSGLTYLECIRLSLYVSDNSCAIELRLAGPMSELNAMFKNEGYQNTYLILDGEKYVSKRTSTNDLALLFQRLEEGTLLTEPYAAYLKDPLYNQIWLNKIPAGVPAGVTVFNKTGQLFVESGLIEADTATVRGPKSTYVLTVMGYNRAEGKAITAISKLIYQKLQDSTTETSSYPLIQFTTNKATTFASSPGGGGEGLPAGTGVELNYSQGKWFYVYYNNRLGWINENDLTINNAYSKVKLKELQ